MDETNKVYDNHGRPITYLRLSVTDRCNLRCFYCMPEEGVHYLPKSQLLTYEEMYRIVKTLVGLGVEKVRITGGEPFVRKDLMQFLWQLSKLDGLKEINLTTNGVLTAKYIPELKQMGIHSVNLSIDTLDRERFKHITRRDELDKVMETFHLLLAHDIQTKLNAVVMEGKNEEDIIPLAELTKNYPVSVRYIEEMPFNGTGANYPVLTWNHRRILEKLQEVYPEIHKIPDGANSTSYNYAIPNHLGTVGIIAAYSRTFCGTCNRIRITAQGHLKTCLYDNGVLDIKQLIRQGASDEVIRSTFLKTFKNRAKDGFEAEQRREKESPIQESMSTIGG